MKTAADLYMIVSETAKQVGEGFPDVGLLIIAWQWAANPTAVQMTGHVEATRDLPRMLRELADKIEKNRNNLVHG